MPNLPNNLSENNPSSSTAAMGIGEIIDDCVGGDENFISNAEKNSSNCNGASSNSNDNGDATTNLRHKKVIEKTMIWTELEACKRQVNQIGVSACGATALINVLQV